jgi:hypothetical protein
VWVYEMKPKYLVFAVFLAILETLGCSRKIDPVEATGSYGMGDRSETLVVKSDGTYTLACNSIHGIMRRSGKWDFRYEDERSRITFESFVACESDPSVKPAIWDAEIRRSWRGKVRISVDSERGLYLTKD